MNPNIILAGQQPNFVNILGNAANAASATNAVRRDNALARLYSEQGPQIAAGNPNALAALARLSPEKSMGMEQGRLQITATREALTRAREAARNAAADRARGIDAEEAAQASQAIQRTIAAALQAQSQEQLDAFLQNTAPELVGQVTLENRELYAAQYLGIKDALDMAAGPSMGDRYKTVGGQLVDLYAEGGPAPVQGVDGRGAGLSVTMPDGTVIQQGGVPSAQNRSTSATARDGDTLSSELTKDDADYLTAERDRARAAEDLRAKAEQLEVIAPRVGYTGPGGEAYGRIDDAIGVLPGDEGARGAFRSLSTEAQLTFTERTKGAITEREMALFRMAVPNLGQTKEANAFMAKTLQAGAERVETRAKFMEEYARLRGGLQGAEDAWDRYMKANPILSEVDGELRVMPEGDWKSAVAERQSIDLTPERIMQMGAEELVRLPVEQMTIDQVRALKARLDSLNGQP